jgi:Protein of unknown function (DUF1579)
MNIPENFNKSAGDWHGTNSLFLSEDNPGIESASTATVGFEANEKVLKINYDWAYEDKIQTGLMMFCFGKDSNVTSVWIDSFHQNGTFMNCLGTIENGKISVRGNYTQPEYADWAWRTTVEADGKNSFNFTMYNVSPDGNEDIAVESKFERIN